MRVWSCQRLGRKGFADPLHCAMLRRFKGTTCEQFISGIQDFVASYVL